jgi:hypothetical protein
LALVKRRTLRGFFMIFSAISQAGHWPVERQHLVKGSRQMTPVKSWNVNGFYLGHELLGIRLNKGV